MKYFLLSLLFINSALAETITINLQDRRPEVYIKDSKNFGPIVDIANELMQKTKNRPYFEWVPWSRTLAQAQGKASILLTRHSMIPERRSFLMPIPYGQETRSVYFMKNKKSKFKVVKYEELLGHTIGYRNKSYYSPRFSSDNNLTKVTVKRDELLVKLLHRKRLDIVITNSIVQFKEMVKATGLSYEKNFEPLEFKDTFYNGRYFSIPMNSKLAKKYDELNCAMFEMRKSGRINHYFKSHNLDELIQSFDDEDSKRQKESCDKKKALKK